jgi:hypothetical protein
MQELKCKARDIKRFIKNVYLKKLGYSKEEAHKTLATKLATKSKYVYKYIDLVARRVREVCERSETIDPVILEAMIESEVVRIALAKRSRAR